MRSLCVLSVTLLLLAAPAVAQNADPFSYDPKQPLDVQEVSAKRIGGATLHDINYASPKGGRVPAYLMVPDGKGPFAGVLFMHWGQGNRSEFVAEALALAPYGVESLMIDAPTNRPGLDFGNGPDSEPRAYAHLVIDLRRALDLLLSRPGVDTKRIGYVGHSLGATFGGVLAGLEKRVKAYVFMGGLPNLYDLDWPDPKFQERLKKIPQADLDAEQKLLKPISPELFVGHAAPAALLFQFAELDRFISKAAADKFFAAASEPKQQRWYWTSHEFNDTASLRDRTEFLRQQLNLKSAK